jgi:hypothetical protein
MKLSRALRVFTTRDLVVIAVLAALGIAIKPVVVPLAHLVSAPLFIPAGALAGGLYMMWLVVGMGIVGKRGTATLIALVQALLVMLTGVVGSHGALSLISYTLPGIVMDLGLWLTGHRACCLRCCFMAGILANVTGTLMVSFIFFRLPPIPLALTLCTAALSGGVGGILAWRIIKALRRHHVGVVTAGRAATGSMLLAVAAFTVVALLGATGCSREEPVDAAPGAALAAVGAAVPAGIPLVQGATGENSTLSLAEVATAADAGGGSAPLSDLLTAAGAPAERVAVYVADGSLLRLPADDCSITPAGTLVAEGADRGAVTGIVAGPPAATITDVERLAREELEDGGRALVVYLDGFGYDQFVAARQAGLIPEMSALKASRALAVYPTITPVTYAAMVSGQDPGATGVHDRSRHRLDCPSIYDWAGQRGLSTSLVEGDMQILALTPDIVLNVDEDGDGLTDDEVMAAALEILRTGRPDFMLVHLHGIDDTAHATGPHSAATRRVVVRQDDMVGELLRRWRGRVIVVADHGQHAVDDETTGGPKGEHGGFRSEDLFTPILVREADREADASGARREPG